MLAQQRAINLESQQQGGLRTHFEFDWRVLAAINPQYRAFVEHEIARLGEDHPAIQTQYFLHILKPLEPPPEPNDNQSHHPLQQL